MFSASRPGGSDLRLGAGRQRHPVSALHPLRRRDGRRLLVAPALLPVHLQGAPAPREHQPHTRPLTLLGHTRRTRHRQSVPRAGQVCQSGTQFN